MEKIINILNKFQEVKQLAEEIEFEIVTDLKSLGKYIHIENRNKLMALRKADFVEKGKIQISKKHLKAKDLCFTVLHELGHHHHFSNNRQDFDSCDLKAKEKFADEFALQVLKSHDLNYAKLFQINI